MMYELTKGEAVFILDLLRELRDPEARVEARELTDAIEILEALIDR